MFLDKVDALDLYLHFITELVDVAIVLSYDAEILFVEVVEVVIEVGITYQAFAFAVFKLDI